MPGLLPITPILSAPLTWLCVVGPVPERALDLGGYRLQPGLKASLAVSVRIRTRACAAVSGRTSCSTCGLSLRYGTRRRRSYRLHVLQPAQAFCCPESLFGGRVTIESRSVGESRRQ